MSGNWAVRTALRLYPGAYRGERGAEMAGVHEEATAGAGRWERLRGLADLAGYGLRLRLGLGSAGIPARLLAVAAPFAAGALAGDALYLAEAIGVSVRAHRPVALFGAGNLLVLDRAALAVLALAAVAALFGRWTATRAVALAGAGLSVAAEAVLFLATAHRIGDTDALLGVLLESGPRLLWAMLLLAAPRDLLPPVSWRSVAAVCGGALVAGPVLYETVFGLTGADYLLGPDVTRLLVPVFAVIESVLLLAAVPALLRGRLLPAAALVQTVPLAVLVALQYAARSPLGFGGVALLMLAGMAGVTLLARYWHPAVPRRGTPRF